MADGGNLEKQKIAISQCRLPNFHAILHGHTY